MVLHVKYPSMERQDLSQSQLGAFKFTPVDEEPRGGPYQHPLLLQQYSQSLQNAGYDRHVKSPDLAADPNFFWQNQSRPAVDNSRLVFRPAASRAPAHSVSPSPKKRSSHYRDSMESMRPNTQAFHPQLFGSSENESLPSMFASESNSMPMSEGGVQAFCDSQSSLLRALNTEQEAHEATKVQLDHEIKARHEAEAETRRSVEHNKSLLNSIKLLQSTVKHMVQKENEPQNKSDVKAAVKNYDNNANIANATNSILYDVLSNYKVPHKTTTNGQETISMINLDLLQNPDTNDTSEKAQIQRTLRRQMGLSSGAEMKQDHNNEYKQKIEAMVRQDEKMVNVQENCADANVSPAQPVMNRSSTTQISSESHGCTLEPPSGAMPELPASFLSKYGRRPAQKSDDISYMRTPRENEQVSVLDTPRKASLTAASALGAHDFDKENRIPTRIIYMPDAPLIDWKIDGRLTNELRGSRTGHRFDVPSHFSEHPIRFVPRVSDGNIYRTVMIDFIPLDTSYAHLLEHIRGGRLESIQMYGPIGNATDYVTARIVFTDETGAVNLYKRGQDPGIKVNGYQVRVWQVLEPTYPKNTNLEEAIYVNGHTRILIVNAPLGNIDQVLKRKLRPQIEQGLVLDIGRSHDGVPIVEFTSIEEATRALDMLLSDQEFGGSDFDFEEDYCKANYD